MADTLTKSVAARLPFDAYVQVITKAAEMKLTVSEYLILKLYAPDRSAALEAELTALNGAINGLRSELSAEKERSSAAEQKVANLTVKSQEAQKKIAALSKASTTARTDARKEAEQIDTLKATLKGLQAELAGVKKELAGVISDRDQELEIAASRLAEAQETARRWQAEAEKDKQALAHYQARMQELRARLQAEHDNSLLDKISSDYWKIINAYLPKPQKG